MNKVVTISLNGSPYQLEEGGYDALRAYLDHARTALASNPDREEVVRDLEQAIADKFRTYLTAYKSVMSTDEVAKVLQEMGPVEGSPEGSSAADSKTPETNPRRLYRLEGGKVIFGVCAGIAAYLDVDVTVVRVVFVVLTIATSGGWILAYFIMMALIPEANTPEARAAAQGSGTVTAQELIDRAKREYAKWDKHAWKARQKEWKRQAKQQWRQEQYHHRSSFIGELFRLAFIILVFWLIYTYLPGTHPYYHWIGNEVQNAWAWLNAKVAH